MPQTLVVAEANTLSKLILFAGLLFVTSIVALPAGHALSQTVTVAGTAGVCAADETSPDGTCYASVDDSPNECDNDPVAPGCVF